MTISQFSVSVTVSGLIRLSWYPYTCALIGVSTDLSQWEHIMEVKSMFLFKHLIYSGSIPTLSREDIPLRAVIIFERTLLGDSRLNMMDKIPSCPPTSLLYTL